MEFNKRLPVDINQQGDRFVDHPVLINAGLFFYTAFLRKLQIIRRPRCLPPSAAVCHRER